MYHLEIIKQWSINIRVEISYNLCIIMHVLYHSKYVVNLSCVSPRLGHFCQWSTFLLLLSYFLLWLHWMTYNPATKGHKNILDKLGWYLTCWCPGDGRAPHITRSPAHRHDINALTHWGWDKMVTSSQTTLSSAFSWMKMLEFQLKVHWSLFLRVQLTIFQHWFW